MGPVAASGQAATAAGMPSFAWPGRSTSDALGRPRLELPDYDGQTLRVTNAEQYIKYCAASRLSGNRTVHRF
jgi:hypothetical protein